MSYKGFDKLFANIEKAVNANQETILKEAAEAGVELIKGRTRSGYQLKPPTRVRQPPLAESTIEHRKYLAKYNSTHPSFSPARSNLTITGQLVEAVRAIVKTAQSQATIRFYIEDSSRTPYKSGGIRKRKKRGKTPNNAEVAEYLADKGRTFVNLDDAGKSQLLSLIKRQIRLLLGKL